MPVVLEDNSISVGGKVIETAKSVAILEVGEPIVTVGGPITHAILNNDYKYVVFTNTGANQTSYTMNFPESKTCDILVVGGGGGGGHFGGGGGGGGVLFKSSITLASGNYTVKVGKGGVGAPALSNTNGTNGQKSSITISGTEYIADGGGGGGTRNTNAIGVAGNSGGSGGGGSHSNQAPSPSGGSSTKTTYTYAGWDTYGFSGGIGRGGLGDSSPDHASGGGGGAGSIGADFSSSTGGGNGGSGRDFISYFGATVGHNGWFAGGGGGNTYQGAGNEGYANGGNGLFGGGGNGGFDGGTEISAGEALPNTGGGGGGAKYDDGSAEDVDGGDGGSGIVIIRYLRKKISLDAKWTYNSLNANTYYPGNVGIGITNPTYALHVNGNTESTTYSASSKTFKIEHPLRLNKWLYHGCLEGPRFDNIYRGKKLITEGKAEIDIDMECNTTGGMTKGTFPILNTNTQLFLRNNQTYDRVKGKINGSTISIECENATDEIEIDWMVVGERHDEHVINTPLTDSDGNLICEHEIV